MLSPEILDPIESLAKRLLGSSFAASQVERIKEGSISSTFRIGGPASAVFAKLGTLERQDQFEAEADGLHALARCSAFCVPQPFGVVSTSGHAALVMEWLDIRPLGKQDEAIRAGEALAELHRVQGEHYGWHQDNFIGSTPQTNTFSDNWSRFFVEQRLKPQFERAASKGFKGELQRQGERIFERAPALFLEYRPAISLLHGDLWHGNLGILDSGRPALFDPACYYGDREADVAMTELFGGYPLPFYAAYRRHWPLDQDYERRKPLYNLYHILNHLNLFGRGYLSQAERLTSQLAAELGR